MTRNAHTFVKNSEPGKKQPGRPKGVPNKTTALAREAIARFVDGNCENLQKWLDEIADRDGPQAAFKCLMDVVEYHVPKLARVETTGKDEGPIEYVVSWKTDEK
jgi:hypothetical protein